MNFGLKGRGIGMLSLMLVLCLMGEATFAQTKSKRANEATRRTQDAATVFNEIMGAPDNGIPKDLLDKAQAVAVFPGVLKAAFIFGGR
jgi:lipid-binding SYLF domain-containing protein